MRDKDLAQQLSVGINAMNAVRRTSPDVAVFVNTETIRIARFDFVKILTSREASVGLDFEHADVLLRIVGRLIAGLRHIETLFVRRECQPIGSVKIRACHRDLRVGGVEAVESGRLLRDLAAPLIVGLNAVTRIGEPDCAVGFHRNIVRSIKPLAVVTIDKHCELPV